MDKVIPISDLRTRAKEYVDQVRDTDQPVVITQRGRAAAVLISVDHSQAFVATRDEMSHRDSAARLARARKESTAGKATPLAAYIKRRALRR
jgi:prevent-host-death family protein